MNDGPDVLVVGAGPTGLALALQLVAMGGRVVVVERLDDSFRASRALVVHPRTLEVLHPLGVAPRLVARGDVTASAVLHVGHRDVGVELADTGIVDSPYPRMLFLRQAQTEAALREELARRGVQIRWGHALIGLAQDESGVSATVALRAKGTTTTLRASFVVGCDGAHSTVRRLVGIASRGGFYRESVLLADIEISGSLDGAQAHVFVGAGGLLFLFAQGELATWRLLAARSTDRIDPATVPTGSDVQRVIDELGFGRFALSRLAWAEDIPMQYRLADRFRTGRVFVCGDAAHVHSPAAAQGMNTGIQDACNLGWKLALASRGVAAAEAMLDSYEQERRPAARRGIALTSAAFCAEASNARPMRMLRGVAAPLLVPVLLPFLLEDSSRLRPFLRMLTGLRWHYRHSSLVSEGSPAPTRGPRPGDRMPDATVRHHGQEVRLHSLMAQPGFHLLLYGENAPWPAEMLDALRSYARLLHVVHVEAAEPETAHFLVRPDGYVQYRAAGVDLTAARDLITRYLPRPDSEPTASL